MGIGQCWIDVSVLTLLDVNLRDEMNHSFRKIFDEHILFLQLTLHDICFFTYLSISECDATQSNTAGS